MSDNIITGLAVGVPVLILVVVLGVVVYVLGKPSWEMRDLKARAEAGDPKAQAELSRRNELLAAMNRAAGAQDPERQRILTTGRPARAVILGVRPGGMEISAGPVPMRIVEVDLSIEGGSGSPISVRDAVSELHVGRLLKGATVPVRVDTVDEKRVVVLWDTL
jgi:hypothetical protein